MQLSRRARVKGAKKRGFITTGADIIKRETPLALYKGLGAVVTGIVPKMAIRFTSFEAYKKLLANKETGEVSSKATFLGESFCLWGCYAVRTCISSGTLLQLKEVQSQHAVISALLLVWHVEKYC